MMNKQNHRTIVPLLLICIICLSSSLSLTVYSAQTTHKYETGIRITEDNQIINNQIFRNIPIGIAIWSSNNTISDCTFWECSDEGILLLGSNNNIIDCTFTNCLDGIELQKSSNNVFTNCKFTNCNHAGIDGIINNNNNNLFYSCTFTNNCYGCFFKESENNIFENCIFTNNKEDLFDI